MENIKIKFYKDAIEDIITGKKTLEPRPRNSKWIEKVEKAEFLDFTWGARFKPQLTFATAKIEKVEVKPFSEVSHSDLERIALGWENKKIGDFIEVYTDWFSKELEKGYSVCWIYFNVVKIFNDNTP